MILALGTLLWALAILAAFRLLRMARKTAMAPFPFFALWLALTIAAATLYFRPHEDVFGGEDPGSYLNSALTYQRKGAFFYTDELLAETPPADRSVFLYGHSRFGTTKDACLWVKDLAAARMGPRFQPAYPLVMGALARVLPDRAILYVTPLFAVLVALALFCLASFGFPHTRIPAFAAAALYLFNPLTLWHGRCSRPELLASFFIFAGAALLIEAWRKKQWHGAADIVLGALCIAAAPFFHIMAFSVGLPAAAIIAVLILRGRADFILCPVVALGAAVFYILQTACVTDFYRAGRFVLFPLRHPAATALILAAGVSFMAAVFALGGKRPGWMQRLPARMRIPEKWLRAGLAAAGAAAFLTLALLPVADAGRPLLEHALYFTDTRAAAALVSLPIAIAGLAGWVLWITLPEGRVRLRALLALGFLPNLLLAGNLSDFMTTRYLMMTFVPMLALALAALTILMRRVDLRLWNKPVLAIAAAMALIAAGLNQRTHLAAITEYKGLVNFLEPFARHIQKERGILLCEYSRLAAPFEHFFGIPTLGLDAQRKDNYAPAEAAWENMALNHPERPAFFITPFQAPISDRLVFQKIDQATFHSQKIQPARRSLPKKAIPFNLTLTMYRTFAGNDKIAPPPGALPCTYKLGDGNMGLRHFAPRPARTAVITGLPLKPGDTMRVPVPTMPPQEPVRQIFIMAHCSQTNTFPIQVKNPPAIQDRPWRWFSLEDGFFVLQIAGTDVPMPSSLDLLASSDMLLLDAIFLTESGPSHAAEFFPAKELVRKTIPEMTPRWTRANSEILLPAGGSRDAFVLLFAQAPPGADGAAEARLCSTNGAMIAEWRVPAGSWRWLAAPAPRSALARGSWARLETKPLYDPRQPRYPSDLGIMLSYATFLPGL